MVGEVEGDCGEWYYGYKEGAYCGEWVERGEIIDG